MTSYVNNKIKILLSLFVVMLFFPQFTGYNNYFFEQVLSLSIAGVAATCLILLNYHIPLLPLMISLLYFILLCTSICRDLDNIIERDFFELIKPPLFFLIFLLSYNINYHKTNTVILFRKLMFLLFIVACIGLCEPFIEPINEIIIYLYKGTREGVRNRTVFSFISPYTFATVMILPFYYFLFHFFDNKKMKICHFFAFMVVAFSIICSQSRTVLIALLSSFSGLIISTLCFRWIPERKKFLIFLLVFIAFMPIIIPLIMTFFYENFSYVYYGIFNLFNELFDSSFDDAINASYSTAARKEQFDLALSLQDPIPLIGKGIGKDYLYAESFYAMYIYRVGLLGILIHFLFLAYGLWVLRKHAEFAFRNKQKNLLIIFVSIIFYLIALPICYISSAINDQTRSGFIFYFILGFVFKISNKKPWEIWNDV